MEPTGPALLPDPQTSQAENTTLRGIVDTLAARLSSCHTVAQVPEGPLVLGGVGVAYVSQTPSETKDPDRQNLKEPDYQMTPRFENDEFVADVLWTRLSRTSLLQPIEVAR